MPLEILEGELTALGHGMSDAGDGLRGMSGLAAEAGRGGQAMPGSEVSSVLAQAAVQLENEGRRVAELLYRAGMDAVDAEQMFVATDEEQERQFAQLMSRTPSGVAGRGAS